MTHSSLLADEQMEYSLDVSGLGAFGCVLTRVFCWHVDTVSIGGCCAVAPIIARISLIYTVMTAAYTLRVHSPGISGSRGDVVSYRLVRLSIPHSEMLPRSAILLHVNSGFWYFKQTTAWAHQASTLAS